MLAACLRNSSVRLENLLIFHIIQYIRTIASAIVMFEITIYYFRQSYFEHTFVDFSVGFK